MKRLKAFRFVAVLFILTTIAPRGSAAQENGAVDPASLKPPPAAVPLSTLRGADSVVAAPGQTYGAGALHRLMFGDLRRDLWEIPFRVGVLRLDTVGGGLSVLEVSGGKQTLGLRLQGKNGTVYQFRSMVKDPRRALPSAFHWTPFARVSRDQMASQFPLAPMVVAELVEAVDVLVAKPRPVIMPDDPRLGEYRGAFAGRMGWIEVRPTEGEDGKPGFAGSSKINDTYELIDDLREKPDEYVNARAFLRARLIDFLVGDFDRHSDQWRWARFKDGDRFRWDPIPRDRDFAFARKDGFLINTFAPPFYPQYLSFTSRYPDVRYLSWSGQRVDRSFLTSLDRRAFIEVAEGVTAKLNDGVLQRAVGLLPPSYKATGDTLLSILRVRRDNLTRLAGEFYALVAREPGVNGTDGADSVAITTEGNAVRVQIHQNGADGKARLSYDRTFLPGETKEVRIYLHGGDDRVAVNTQTPLPLAVRISTSGDNDKVVDNSSGKNLYVYNSAGDDTTTLGSRAFYTNNGYLGQDSLRTAAMIWKSRDWGSAWVILPSADIQPEVGVLLGGRLDRNGYGFGISGCHSCISLEMLGALRAGEWIGNLEYNQLMSASGWWFANSASVRTGQQTRFYGLGNEIAPAASEDPFTGLRRLVEARSGLRYEPDSTYNLSAGVVFRKWGHVSEGGDIFLTAPYGSGEFQQIGVGTALEIDTRDNKRLPTSGAVARINADYHPSLMDVESAYSTVRGTVRWFRSIPLPFEPALHLRVVGAKSWGATPYEDLPHLGGSSSLPGISRRQFRGDAMASGGALLRAKAFSAKIFTDMDFGLHGVTSIGRVWQPGEESSTWHTASGGGLWIHLPGIGRTLSVTMAKGSKTRTYVDFGFIF